MTSVRLRRLRRTSGGWLELRVNEDSNRLVGTNVAVTAFGAEDWETRRGHWSSRWQHRAPKDERTFPAVIQKAAQIDRAEAEQIAEDLWGDLRQSGVPEPGIGRLDAFTVAVFALAAGRVAAVVFAVVLLVT